MLEFISLAAAITLTEWSESTFRRRFSDGSVTRNLSTRNGKSMLHFDSIKAHLCIALSDEDLITIERADEGDGDAQSEVGLMFLENKKHKSAFYWFNAASKHDNADAMHWLGRCYLEGAAILKDENIGMMWLSKSAALGHVISMAQMKAIRDQVTGQYTRVSS